MTRQLSGQVSSDGDKKTIVERMSATPESRFLVGSVITPLILVLLTIFLGTVVGSFFQRQSQEWHAERERVRDVVEGLRASATNLSLRLQVLVDTGGAVERIRANKSVSPSVRSVDESLIKIEGSTNILAALNEETAPKVDLNALRKELETCKSVVDSYTECLYESLTMKSPGSAGQPCTDSLQDEINADGSCRSLGVTAFSVGY